MLKLGLGVAILRFYLETWPSKRCTAGCKICTALIAKEAFVQSKASKPTNALIYTKYQPLKTLVGCCSGKLPN